MRRPVAIADALILPQYSLNHCSDQYTIYSLLKLPMRSISIFNLYEYYIKTASPEQSRSHTLF